MKLTALISGGIDSPVAAYMMAKVGAEVVFLHMDNGIYGDERELEKVIKIAENIEKVTGRTIPVYVANHENAQTEIKKKCDNAYQCVMCKRVMHNVAKRFSIEQGCNGIIMGDSLGQVASQTLRNIKAEQNGLDFPILRPLIGMDKLEIIEIAKKIGTYDISIIQTKGCAVVPAKPITEATSEKIRTFQNKMEFDEIVSESALNAKRVR